MITDKTTDIQVESTIQGDKVAMTMDENALAHLMGVMTNLYQDPEMAVLREYTTNARDSHIEAGQTRPVEVSLPGNLSPMLRIKDYGVGLDSQDIHDIYSKYGASTKRETNEQTGMLGLGCKSALAYTSQFTLIGVKNGFKTVVAISREDDGSGSMTIVEMVPSNEPSGVEIVIPAKEYNGFEHKAQQLFSYWEPGTVIVNGVAPKPVEGLQITDDIMLVEGGDDVVIMGNVPYPADISSDLGMYNYGVVARVLIGSVNFPPARESLMDTAKTRATVEKVKEQIREHTPTVIQAKIDEATKPIDALRLVTTWRNLMPAELLPEVLKFGGNDVPERFEFGEGDKRVVVSNHHSTKLSAHNRVKSLNAETFAASLLVKGYDKETFTPSHKKKLKKYCEDNEITGVEHFLLIKPKRLDKELAAWIDSSMVINWKTIDAIKLPRSPRQANNSAWNAGRSKGSYDLYVNGEHKWEVPGEDIDTTKPVYYYEILAKEGRWYNPNVEMHEVVQVLNKYRADYTLVPLSRNRVAKFERLFPTAVPVKDELVKIFNRVAGKYNEDHATALAIHSEYYAKQILQYVKPDRVDDPEVVKAAEMVQGADKYKDPLAVFVPLMSWMGVVRPKVKARKFVNPMGNYPLIDWSDLRKHPDHCYTYMNTIYAATQSSQEDDE